MRLNQNIIIKSGHANDLSPSQKMQLLFIEFVNHELRNALLSVKVLLDYLVVAQLSMLICPMVQVKYNKKEKKKINPT